MLAIGFPGNHFFRHSRLQGCGGALQRMAGLASATEEIANA
jgi:hypothetical protein